MVWRLSFKQILNVLDRLASKFSTQKNYTNWLVLNYCIFA